MNIGGSFILVPEIFHKAFAPETWSGWGVVVVGIVAAFVAYFTLKAIHHEAAVAQEIAQAANRNAQAIINSERAWLVATIERSPDTQSAYKIAILNQGRTPALLIGGDSGHCFADLPDNLPVPPIYNAPFVMPNQTFIVNRDSFPVLPSFAPEAIIDQGTMRDLVQQSRKFLMFFGRVIYEDTFTNKAQPIRHETRWCYCYSPHNKEFSSCGPNEYRGHY